MLITFSTTLDRLPGERILTPDWSWRLVVVSYAISWIGAYTSSAIIAHANTLLLRSGTQWCLWMALASITYGSISIWSLHFLAMLSQTFEGIDVSFHPVYTTLSALVATFFTFAALISSARSPFRHPFISNRPLSPSPTALPPPLDRSSPFAFFNRLRRRTSFPGRSEEVELDSEFLLESGQGICSSLSSRSSSPLLPAKDLRCSPRTLSPSSNKYTERSYVPINTSSDSPSDLRSYNLGWGTGVDHDVLEEEDEDETGEKLEARSYHEHRHLSSARHNPHILFRLGREVREGASVVHGLKALIWGSAIALMHHIGMKAMNIPEGRVIWNPVYIALSCSLVLVVSWLGCITIDQMDFHLSRQLLFATLTSLGAFGFHYVSALGATYLTAAPPDLKTPISGFRDEIPFFITGLAVCTCLLSIGLLAHTASLSRNRLAELIFTKRRLWKVKAQKLAAEGAADLKQNFISVASHELRTPLFSVTGYADLLGRTDLNDEQKLYLANMQQACANMQLIIANVLDFSKLERNNEESNAKPVCMNLRAMVEGIGRMTEDKGRSVRARSVDLIVHVSAIVPETALVDETFVLRICMNLLSNALKFTEKGFILISLDMNEPEELVIKVQDTGIGIPRSFRKDLFEPYRQADSSTTRPHQGTGLGLSICKQLVQRLDGKIEVDSIEGEGTTFVVTLPLGRPSSPPLRSPTELGKRICVAYQEPRTESALSNLLRRDGHLPVEYHSTPKGSLNDSEIDMVWTDLGSVRDSTELQTLTKVESEDSKVVVVTSSSCALGKSRNEIGEGLSGKVIELSRHGIIPHLIFNLLSQPEKYAHEISSRPDSWPLIDRRESVGTIVTVNSNEDLEEMAESEIEEKSQKQDLENEEEIETKKKILLVDDNGMNVELGRRVLEKIGYEVQVAYNGLEAVQKACHSDCDLVLMDCQMPGVDGPEATRMIRDYETKAKEGVNRLPIIALTANVSESDQTTCMESGMDGFLPKPLQVTVLKATLHRFLG
ncbi:uncharacterized protein MELLADRAFT_115560 [Melampsora larici-populina 98AG31]|uniref:Uncharacterized protein n=1 Tax=Melampsora larici-populina (strain 98AG31 / pathotype 3-4-7) TaxID=747676 RepID=F4RBK7_MELLP|nr:uncharacterized protein MELLADRAFT_115560 [Melampsora larici-populina 98AG31]EGG10319.1 hypothetical protein MELLADRAFT_115560 [Melampsora larici-populina 98AG31]